MANDSFDPDEARVLHHDRALLRGGVAPIGFWSHRAEVIITQISMSCMTFRCSGRRVAVSHDCPAPRKIFVGYLIVVLVFPFPATFKNFVRRWRLA
jgi:hypothetical protein